MFARTMRLTTRVIQVRKYHCTDSERTEKEIIREMIERFPMEFNSRTRCKYTETTLSCRVIQYIKEFNTKFTRRSGRPLTQNEIKLIVNKTEFQ